MTKWPNPPPPPAPLVRLSERTGVPLADLLDAWNERAGVREYCGNMSRAAAELAALSDVLALYEGDDR